MRRWAWVVAGLGAALGCGNTTPEHITLLEAEAAPPAPVEDASEEPEEGPPPIAWTEISANIIDDVVSVWGSATDVYVGGDKGAIYDIASTGATTDDAIMGLVGAGWAVDEQHAYAVAGSGWEALAGLGDAAGTLYRDVGGSDWEPISGGPFTSVWGTSAQDIYAGGPSGVAHATDGTTFVAQTISGTSAGVLALGGSGATDIYATTSDPAATILHSAGDGAWTPVFAQPSGAAWGVWGSEPGDAYVIVSPRGAGDPDAFVLHSSGDGWTSESVGQPGSVLVTIWGSGPEDVYVGGWHVGGDDGRVGDLFHSTGDGTWTRVELPGTLYEVTSVWGRGPRDVFVGVYDVEAGPTLLHGG
jgi:hypothetical protein